MLIVKFGPKRFARNSTPIVKRFRKKTHLFINIHRANSIKKRVRTVQKLICHLGWKCETVAKLFPSPLDCVRDQVGKMPKCA